MHDDFHSYEPAQGHGLKHDPIASILGLRPIGWIATRDADGRANLAPYSFFNVFNYKPPIVAFASVGWKDTIRNTQATGEFVVNLATRTLAEQVNLTSASVPSDVDEFELAGLTPAACLRVSAPRVAQSPVALECRVTQVQQLAAALLRDGIYRTEDARPILRAGGPADYFEITPGPDRFHRIEFRGVGKADVQARYVRSVPPAMR